VICKKVFYSPLIAILMFLYAFPVFAFEIEGWVKGDICWVVKEPSEKSTIVGFLKRKAAITVEDLGNEWLRIVFAPVRDPKTGKFIDCAGCYIQKENFTTVLGQW
jgi:hypothetical protein